MSTSANQTPPFPGPTDLLIRARGLGRIYGLRAALAAIDLDVRAGESIAILGPNASGKTTLLRLIAQLARPTSGTLSVAGIDVATPQAEIRRAIGFVSHHSLLYSDLTVGQNLLFYARIYGLSDIRRRIQESLVRVGLEGHRSDLVRDLSPGMRQRVAVARALLPSPTLLLFDAPFSGLDTAACNMLERIIREEIGRGHTLLLATHDVNRALALCHRAVVLNRGRVCADLCLEGMQAAELCRAYEELTGRWPQPTSAETEEPSSHAAEGTTQQ